MTETLAAIVGALVIVTAIFPGVILAPVLFAEQASCLPSGFDWDRKAAAHAEIVNLLAAAAADPALAVLVRDVPGQPHDLMVTLGPAAGGIIAGSRGRLLALL
jgi:hypothetical protein